MNKTIFKQIGLYLLLFAIEPAIHLNLSQASTHTSTQSSRDYISPSNKELGLGVIFGEPTGLNLKYWMSNSQALNFGLTYSFNNYFIFYTDYLWHFTKAFASHGRHGSEFVPYIGIGAEIFLQSSGSYYTRYTYYPYNTASSVLLGARIPFGLEFIPHAAPIGIFAEIVPGIGLLPGIFGYFQGGIGVRFYI